MYITPLNGTNSDEPDSRPPVSCVLLEPQEVWNWWPQIEPLVSLALTTEASGETSAEIRELAVNGDVHVWLAVTSPVHVLSVGITKFQPYLRYLALELYLAAGEDLHRWKSALHVMEKFAKRNGCEWVFVDGRRGFVRLFDEYGYTEQYTRVGKRLTDGR